MPGVASNLMTTLTGRMRRSNEAALQAQRTAHAKGVYFTGHDEGRAFTLDIQGVPCQDTMSGEPFEFTATFKYGEQTLTGCARRGL